MSIIKNRKLFQANTPNYPLGYSNNFLTDGFYHDLEKEVINFTNESEHDKSVGWKPVRHSLKEFANSNHRVLGGGYEGDTIEKFQEIFKQRGLEYLPKLFKSLHSQKFANKIYEDLGLSTSNVKPLKLRDKNDSIGLYDFLNYENVYMNFKLSCYPPGSGIAFHRDNQRKLVGMLLYFGFSDGINREVGGTQFASDHKAEDGWNKLQENHSFHENSNLEIVHDHKPQPNSFAAFFINDSSWHRIDPYEAEGDIYRLNLQINFMRSRKLNFLSKIANKFLRKI
ncbi:MAG: hypothetical protein CMI87_04920 [Pelagibacteraceae bacterium]|nr:hypothetical protein [Pelagibacteraceae bacterium]